MAPPRVPLTLHRWSRLRRLLEVLRDVEFVRRGEEARVLLLEDLLLLPLKGQLLRLDSFPFREGCRLHCCRLLRLPSLL